jgi:Zn-dependent protease with chaperone function
MAPPIHPLQLAAELGASAAAGNLISAVWQGTLLAAGAALCLRIFPRLSAASRSLVWMNVFALLVLLDFAPAMVQGHGHALSAAPSPWIDLDPRWSAAIAAAWIGLSLWRAAELAASAMRLRGLAARATPLHAGPEIEKLLGNGGRKARFYSSDEITRPSVLGFFRPRVLLPPGLVDRLTELELRQVVLHEMEHLRRGDDWTNLLQKVALVLFPLNPALFWVERRLCAERELACDDRVQKLSGAGKSYAICLARLAEYSLVRRGISLALGAWERRPELVRRVHRLLRGPHAAMGRFEAGVAVAGVMIAVLGGTLALARSPQIVGFAQPAEAAQAGADSPNLQAAQVSLLRAAAEREAENARMVETRAVVTEPANAEQKIAARPARKRSTIQREKPRVAPSEQTFVVLTDWTGTVEPVPAVLLKLDARNTYAAVPLINGWLIVKI